MQVPFNSCELLFEGLKRLFPDRPAMSISNSLLQTHESGTAVLDIEGALVLGQHDYTIHRLMARKPVLVTLLHDPVRRAVLAYEDYARCNLGEEVDISVATNIEDFLDTRYASRLLDDHQVRQIVGSVEGGDRGHSDELMLELARMRLDEFACFGITERWAESIELIEFALGGTGAQVDGPAPPQWMPIDETVRSMILQRNRLDAQLHSFGIAVFEKRVRQLGLVSAQAAGGDSRP